ncbi:MAG: hypothetical protein K6T85_13010 [Gorillibacterium sp.]|nr:hypothetical protein [Gorillibacterium sp.]
MVLTAVVMQECACPTELSEVFEQMQQEHEELSLLLVILKQMAAETSEADRRSHSFHAMTSLKQSTVLFMNRFEDHLQWGKNELFPLVSVYAGTSCVSSIMTSIREMGNNYDLAVRYVNSFLQLSESEYMIETPEGLEVTWSNMLRAMVILSDYLELEKNKVFPLADQLLTDIDYLFS